MFNGLKNMQNTIKLALCRTGIQCKSFHARRMHLGTRKLSLYPCGTQVEPCGARHRTSLGIGVQHKMSNTHPW